MAAEKRFENRIKEFLTSQESWFIKYWAGAKFTKEGIPDILACINGRFFGIEVKAEKGKPSLIQLINLRKIRKAGGIGVLLYPDDFEGFKEMILYPRSISSWYGNNVQMQLDWIKRLEE